MNRLARASRTLVSSLFVAAVATTVMTCSSDKLPLALSFGAPAQLAFSVQPPSPVTAGAVIAPAVEVIVQDAQGNTVATATNSVTLAITSGTGAAGAVLGGTLTQAAANGVATFSDLTVDKTGAGYTLTATATGLTATASTGFTVNPGPAVKVVFTVQPSAVAAGATMAPAVQVTLQDAKGNIATTASGTVTLALTTAGGATLTGGGATAVTNGVATFAGLKVNKVGTYTLTPTTTVGTVTTLPASGNFTVSPGAATQLVWTQQPSAVAAGATMSPAVTLSVQDAGGNVVTSASGTVTLALTTAGGATLTGGGAATVTNGVATFAGLKVDKVGTYTFTPATTVSGVTTLPVSASFAVSAGAASQLAWTQQPTAVVSGATMAPAVTVTVEDAGGNVVTSASGTVTLALTTAGGATLTGGGATTVTNGVATFAGLKIDKVGTYTFTPSTTVTGVTTLPASASFAVSAGAATQLVWTQQPSAVVAGAAMAPAVTVTVEDASGNVVTAASGTVTLALTTAGGATLTGGGATTVTNGVATFAGLKVDKVGTYTFTPATTVSGVTTLPASASFAVSVGAATQLVWTQQPTAVVAGATMAPAVTVTVEDASGNVVTGASGTVTLALTTAGGATLTGGGATAVTNGVATFAGLKVDKAGTYTFTPTTTVSGVTTMPASASFAVSAGAASQLAWTQQPSAVVAGATMAPAVTVTVQDASGNVVTGASGTVTLALTTAGGATLTGGGPATVTNGVATFAGLKVDKVGTYTFTPATTVSGVTTLPASASFAVSVGAASQLVWTQQPTAVVAGATMAPAVTVSVEDASGNVVTGASGTVTLALTTAGGATLTGGGATAVTNGVATFNGLKVDKAGTYTFTPTTTVSGVTTLPASASFAVSVGTATQLAWTQQPSAVVAGATMAPAVTVTVEDASGNVVTGASGTVTLALTTPGGATLTGGAAAAVTNGVATFAGLSIDKVGTYTFTPTTTVSGVTTLPASASFAVSVGAATQLVWTQQPTAVVSGATMAPAVTVSVEDASGNVVTGASGTVTLALTAAGGATLTGGAATAVTNGVATFAGLKVDKVGTYTFTPATTVSGVTTLPASASFAVSAGTPAKLAVTVEPSAVTAGASVTPAIQVAVQDAQGNTVTGASNSVTVAITGGTGTAGAVLGGTLTQAPVSGIASFGNLTIDKAGAGYTLSLTASGLTGTTTTAFTVSSALVTTQAVASTIGTAGAPIPSFTPVTASGGTTPYAFALSGGALPTGMNFNTANGQISGTPATALALTTFTVTVTDAAAATSFKTFDLTVNGALSTTQAVATKGLTVNTAYTPFTPVTAAGGTTPYAFALTGGTLPVGMNFNAATGQISGTATATLATTTFTVTVTDAAAATSFKTFDLTVNGALLTTQAVPSKVGTVGAVIAPFVPVTASGGTTPYAFALSGGTLPTGLNFDNATGQVSGTPTAALALTTFTVTVTDAAGATSNKTFDLTVNSALVTTQAVASTVGTQGAAITPFTPVTATGGTTPYNFALSVGSLPNGLNFNTATGQVTGTPTATLALTTFTVTVTDAAGASSFKTFDLTINGALTTTQAVASTVGTAGVLIPAFTPVTASGGTTPYAFALSGGSLPAGMNFGTATGQVSGTPTASLTTTTFTVTVTDAASATSFKTFQLTVNPALVTTQAVPSTALTVNTAYTPFTPVTAAGGTLPYTFVLSGGTLPAGMNFSASTGQISGTPTATLGTTTFTVTVGDAAGASSFKTFDLTVNAALVTTQAVATKGLTINTAYAPFTPVTAAGGTLPYAFALTGGSLAAGMNFNTATGQISGTPTASLTTTTFTVTVTDAAAATSFKTFQLTVNPALVTAQSVPTTVGTQGALIPTFVPVTASGGTTPYSYALTVGTLPAGMNFNTATGEVSGTPTASLVTTTFTVTVTDAAAATSSKTFQLTVNPTLLTTQAVAATQLTVNTPYAPFTPVTASQGTTPYNFAISGGSLPAGMNFSATTGQISGTPTATLLTTTFTVTVTDAAAATSSKTFDLTVNPALTTTQAVASKGLTINTAYAPFTPVTAAGGTAPYAFALSGGSLASGMNFSASTGQISGTPTATLGQTTFTVTVTDAAGATSFKTFDLTVNPALTTTQAVASTVGTAGALIPTFTPVTAGGGTTPYVFALSGGALPGGMNFNTTNGQVSGTPATALALTTFTVTVTDAAGATSNKTFDLTVNSALVTTQAVPTKGLTINIAYTPFTPVTASGGTLPYAFALSGGSLPAGMNFSTSNGQISGTPTATLATATFTVTVTDAAAATSFKTFQLTVNGPLLTTQAVPAKVGTNGAVIPTFVPVTASGGTTPYAYALSGGALPAGMNFNTATGEVSGTPTANLALTMFTVTVTDAATATSSKTFQLTVNPPLVTTAAVPSTVGTQNAVIATFVPVTASGGTAPYDYALSGGSLPSGMSFSLTTGQVSGTPTTTLPLTTFTVTVTDAAGASSFKTFALTVNTALGTSVAVASKVGTVGAAIPAFAPVTASGGTTPYTFSLDLPLPTGLNLNAATGQISGTPTASITVTTFTMTVTDAAAATSSKTFQLTVNPALVTVQAVASTVGTQNALIPTFTPVTVSGGTTPYAFALSGGTLPTGMSFSSTTGQVSGTPTTTLALTTFTVTVTDAASATSSKTFDLTVNSALVTTVAVPTTGLTINTAYTPFTPVTASGGTLPYAFALSGGSLATGMDFNTATGQISGTPMATLGTTTFTVTVTDAAAATSSKTFQLTVNGALVTTVAVPSKALTIGTGYTPFIPVTATGGTQPYNFALSGGSLPTGMSFSTSTGQISGTPAGTLGMTTFTVTVTDAASATSTKTFDLTVNSALLTSQAVPTTNLTVNTPYTPFTPVTASGGTTPYNFAISVGSLPAGMSLSPTTGQVSGTPTATLATTTFTVTVTDAAGASSFKTFDLTVNSALVTTQAVATKALTVNTGYTPFTPVTASGGTTPYSFAVTVGTLPAGMSIDPATGQISGTPTATLLTTTFTVQVTDAASATSSKTFQLTVNPPLVTTLAVPSVVGTANATAPNFVPFTPVTASGGTLAYTFALTGGTLPGGMSFSTSNGQVSGTPTAPLTLTTFTVTVTDAAGATSSQSFNLTINPALLTSQAVPTTGLTINTAYTPFTPVTASQGTTPYAFVLSGGSLPAGMTYDGATGQISGTPTATLTTTTFTMTVTDAAGASSSRTFVLTVNPPLLTNQAVPTTVGTANAAAPNFVPFTPVTASGGTLPYAFALSGGSLPAGMNFSTTTGQVSGTPTAPLTLTTFTVTVTDAAGATSGKTFNLTVNSALTATQSVPTTTLDVNLAYTPFTPVTVTGGTGTSPYNFALSGGSLPAGMSFDISTGQISGTATAPLATTTFTVTITDAAGASAFQTFSLTVNPAPVATHQGDLSVTAGNPILGNPILVTASGGTTPYAFAVSGATLPAGVLFDASTGALSGTPGSPFPTTTFTVTVTDALGATSSATFQLTVN